MLHNEINSDLNYTQAQQDDLDLNKMMQDQSNTELVDNPQAQQNKLSGLLQQSIKDFSMWPAKKQIFAVSAAGGLFATVLPLLLAALPLAATGAMIGLALFFSVKAVQSGYKGLKWSAEKTVEGAKHIGGKVKSAASSIGQATREGTGSALKTMGDSVQKLGRKVSDSGISMSDSDTLPYLVDNQDQTVILKTEEKTRNFNNVKETLIKEVFEDRAVNSSALTKEMFSKLRGKVLEKAYSIDGQQSAKKDQLINRLKQQIDFCDKLDAKKLQNLLAKDNNSLYEIFSEHHDEFKEVIRECKKEHTYFNTLESLNKSAKRYKASSMSSLESSLSGSSAMDSLRTDSTISSEAELLNSGEHKKVKAPTSLFGRLFSSSKDSRKQEGVTCPEYRKLSENEMPSAGIGNSTSYVAPPKPPRSNSIEDPFELKKIIIDKPSRSNSMDSLSTDSTATTSSFDSYRRSSDSGFNSPSSSPQHGMLTEKDGKLKTQADLKKTGSLEKLVEYQQPSSEVTVDSTVEQQAPKIRV